MSAWLVVSDVDHTLLEGPAEIAEAGRCLRRLEAHGVATLLASSKTFAEMVQLQEEAGLEPRPFLFENGGGIGWPAGRRPAPATEPPRLRGPAYEAFAAGPEAAELAVTLRQLRQELGLRFALLEELGFEGIRRHLGLEASRARQALQRLVSVPLLWQDDAGALQRLRRSLAAQGLAAVAGGRLIHVGPGGDKGEALERLRPWLADGGGRRLLACGDSENDRGLLEAADIALVFHPPAGQPLALGPERAGRRRRAVAAGGPGRWLEAVEAELAAVQPEPAGGQAR